MPVRYRFDRPLDVEARPGVTVAYAPAPEPRLIPEAHADLADAAKVGERVAETPAAPRGRKAADAERR